MEPVCSIYGVSPSRADKGALALHRFPMSLEATGAQDILEPWGAERKTVVHRRPCNSACALSKGERLGKPFFYSLDTGSWESQGTQGALLQSLGHLAKGWETE